MDVNIKMQAVDFVGRYFQDTQINATDFSTAIRERMQQFPEPEEKIEFIRAIIGIGRQIKEDAAVELERQEVYTLTGKEL